MFRVWSGSGSGGRRVEKIPWLRLGDFFVLSAFEVSLRNQNDCILTAFLRHSEIREGKTEILMSVCELFIPRYYAEVMEAWSGRVVVLILCKSKRPKPKPRLPGSSAVYRQEVLGEWIKRS